MSESGSLQHGPLRHKALAYRPADHSFRLQRAANQKKDVLKSWGRELRQLVSGRGTEKLQRAQVKDKQGLFCLLTHVKLV